MAADGCANRVSMTNLAAHETHWLVYSMYIIIIIIIIVVMYSMNPCY